MRVKTNELTGAALDWAVAKCEGEQLPQGGVYTQTWPMYSSDWKHGGPIIERMCIGIKRRAPCMQGEQWSAEGSILAVSVGCEPAYGPTPLIAAMRCYVGSRMSSPVDVPDELLP